MVFLHSPHFQALDSSGNPLSGALLAFYAPGTTTELTVYQDAGLTTPHTNPVVADASGRFPPIYLAETSYKTQLATSGASVIQTVDPVYGGSAAGWFELGRETASAVSGVNFTGIPAAATEVEIAFSNVVPTADAQNLRLLTSSDGVTYDSGSGAYKYAHVRTTVGGSTQELGSASATEVVLTSGLGTGTAEQGVGKVFIANPGQNAYTQINFTSGGIDASGAMFHVDGSAVRMAVGAVTAVRLYFASGIASGFFVCRYRL